MFGKKSKMTETQKFIIAKGREAGNLKQSGPAFNKKQALATTESTKSGKPQGKHPFGARPISPGKAGPVKLTGD